MALLETATDKFVPEGRRDLLANWLPSKEEEVEVIKKRRLKITEVKGAFIRYVD